MNPRKDIVVGIDMGTHATRVVVCELGVEGRPKLIGTGQAPTQGLRHGYIINRSSAVKSLRAALKDAKKNTGMEITQAYIAIGGISLRAEHIATTTTLTHHSGEVQERDIEQVLDTCEDVLLSRHNNIRILHRIPLKYKLDGQFIPGQPLGLAGSKLSVKTLFITAFDHHVEDLVNVAHDAGVNVIDVAAAPLVANLPVLSHTDRMAGSALVDIGAETVSMVVFENGQPLSLEVFPIGSTDITNDLALGFQVPLDDAQSLKHGSLQPSKLRKYARGRVDEIIMARLSDIAELIERHLVKIKKSHLLPAGLAITGGGAQLELLPQVMKDTLRLPIRIANQGIVESGKRKAQDASWYVAYGLCWFVGVDESIRFSRPSMIGEFFKNLGARMVSTLKHLLP